MAETGYGAARELHVRRLAQGWAPVGRKIGFTNRSIWPRYGVYEPIWGTVYDRTLIRATAGRASVALQGVPHPRIEPEVCFGLKSAPPRTKDPQVLLSSIAWIAHAVEIVQCRHADWKVTLEESTAENGLHARLVLGTPINAGELPGLAQMLPSLEVSLLKAGEVVDRGVGANVLDSPLLALSHLVEVLASQPGSPPLAAGEIVSTGTLTDAHPVQAGESWSTSFSGLPLQGLRIEFA